VYDLNNKYNGRVVVSLSGELRLMLTPLSATKGKGILPQSSLVLISRADLSEVDRATLSEKEGRLIEREEIVKISDEGVAMILEAIGLLQMEV